MKKIMFSTISILLFLNVSCSGESGGNSGSDANGLASNSSPYNGQAYFLSGTKSGTSDTLVYYVKFEGFNVRTLTFIKSASTGHITYRKNNGTYSFSGDKYVANYTYETCNPVGTESFIIKSGNPLDSIMITQVGSPTSLKFFNTNAYYIPGLNLENVAVYTEDVGCAMLSKLQKPNDRIPASATKFDFTIKQDSSQKSR